MRAALFISCFLGFVCSAAIGQETKPIEVETTWPGIVYQLIRVQRIAADRLLVGVKIVAKPSAPKSGTLIGVKVPIPTGASPEDIAAGRYEPMAFSLSAAKMTEEKTGQEYPALAPSPSGQQYIPGEILTTLVPGRAEILTVQFAAPPPPVDESGAPAKGKQTVSILLPNAKEPFAKVALPAILANPEGPH
ncbi:hypothetical protein BH09VER1_BH09VER1_47130 [soil metagenome]